MANEIKDRLVKKRQMLLGLGIGVVAGAILLLVFLAGIFVGRRESGFLFFGRMHNFAGSVVSRYGHGAIGTVDSIGNDAFVIKTRSEELETVLVDSKTVFRKNNSSAKFSDLKKSEEVIVVGDPQEQEEAVQARFVRIINEQ